MNDDNNEGKVVQSESSNVKYTDEISKKSENNDGYLNFKRSLTQYATKHRLVVKLVFVCSTVHVIILVPCVMFLHWILPYYYSVSAPVLLVVRVVQYFRYKWLNFLLDFCYATNIICYVYLWAAPSNAELFSIIFALSNGPLPGAILVFRNSLVFHSVEKMTSVFIHVLPMMLTFSIRWYSVSVSTHWYTPFLSSFRDGYSYMFTWSFGVPLAMFVFHNWSLFILLQLICTPDEQYADSFRYLFGSRRGNMFTRIFGEKGRGYAFTTLAVLYGTLWLLFTIVLYQYFVVHCVFMTFIGLVIIWNGSTYYVDIFGPRQVFV